MGTPPISLILTRPAAANARFIDQLPDTVLGRCRLIESPLIDILPVPTELAIGPEDAVIFTSASAIPFAPDAEGRRAFCVGEATTVAAHAAGWHAIFAGETSDALVAFLAAYPLQAPIWHLAGRHTRGQVVERLTAQGLRATRVTLYDQVLLSLSAPARAALQGPDPVIVPIFSPRTAHHFVQECPKSAHLHAVALSEAVAAPLEGLSLDALEIADHPTAEAMVHSLEKLVARVSLG